MGLPTNTTFQGMARYYCSNSPSIFFYHPIGYKQVRLELTLLKKKKKIKAFLFPLKKQMIPWKQSEENFKNSLN